MRKYFGILVLLLTVSCRKDGDRVTPVPSNVPIEFNARASETKGAASLSTLERLASQKFGVCAWYTPEGNTFGTGSIRYLENHCFGTLSTGDYEHATWGGITSGGEADPVYYPLDGSLSYFCYAPYRADVEAGGESDVQFINNPSSTITDELPNYLPGSPLIRFTPSASTASQIDFIAATPVLDAKRGGGAISLDFTKHVTTKIEFYCKLEAEPTAGEGVMISQIALRKVISSEYMFFTENDGALGYEWCNTISPVDGSSSMPVATYTLSVSTNELITENPYLSAGAAKHVNNTINGICYMLPQTIPADAFLDVTYTIKMLSSGVVQDENTLSIPLSGTTAWPIGKTVRYNLTIGVAARKDITLSASIINWVEAHNTHSDQELLY